jgi:hypothetical protein
MSSRFAALVHELTSAFRAVRRAPGFSTLAIAMLALGIGANVAVFSTFQSIILKPLPFADAERLVGFSSLNPGKAIVQPSISPADFRDFRERSTRFASLAACRPDFTTYAPLCSAGRRAHSTRVRAGHGRIL